MLNRIRIQLSQSVICWVGMRATPGREAASQHLLRECVSAPGARRCECGDEPAAPGSQHRSRRFWPPAGASQLHPEPLLSAQISQPQSRNHLEESEILFMFLSTEQGNQENGAFCTRSSVRGQAGREAIKHRVVSLSRWNNCL